MAGKEINHAVRMGRRMIIVKFGSGVQASVRRGTDGYFRQVVVIIHSDAANNIFFAVAGKRNL